MITDARNNSNLFGIFLILWAAGAIVSLAMNLIFAGSIGHTEEVKWGMRILWAVFDGVKYASLPAAIYFWREEHYFLSSSFVGLFCLLTFFSVFSGQSFLAGVFDKAKEDRLRASEEYKYQQDLKLNAAKSVAASAIPESAYKTALSEITRLNGEKSILISEASKYMEDDCTPRKNHRGQPYTTLAAKYCSKLADLVTAIKPYQNKVRQYESYQSALENQKAVNSLPIATPVTGIALPGITNMSGSLGVDTETFEHVLILAMGIGAELMTNLLSVAVFLMATARKGRESDGVSIQPATITQAHLQALPSADRGAKVIKSGPMLVHEDEGIVNSGGMEILAEEGTDFDDLNRRGLDRMNGKTKSELSEPVKPANESEVVYKDQEVSDFLPASKVVEPTPMIATFSSYQLGSEFEDSLTRRKYYLAGFLKNTEAVFISLTGGDRKIINSYLTVDSTEDLSATGKGLPIGAILNQERVASDGTSIDLRRSYWEQKELSNDPKTVVPCKKCGTTFEQGSHFKRNCSDSCRTERAITKFRAKKRDIF